MPETRELSPLDICRSQRDSATAQVQDLMIELALLRQKLEAMAKLIEPTKPSMEGES